MPGLEIWGEGYVYINNQVIDWVLDSANRLDNFKSTFQLGTFTHMKIDHGQNFQSPGGWKFWKLEENWKFLEIAQLNFISVCSMQNLFIRQLKDKSIGFLFR